MIILFKELWSRWRARVYLTKLQKFPDKRRVLRLKHEKYKAKYDKHVKSYKEAVKLMGEA
jgi:hypothetical protein|tara:strand:+ start:268 stop:447 length:180 start_codon:yes stop_codon:yes gene_type:complete